jgi:hypothetical protein
MEYNNATSMWAGRYVIYANYTGSVVEVSKIYSYYVLYNILYNKHHYLKRNIFALVNIWQPWKKS